MSTIDRLRQFFAKRRADTQTEKEGLTKTMVGQTDQWPAMRRNICPGVRVLLVDDSATIVIMLRKMLQVHNIETIEAADAETALRLVREQKPDLIFLDIILPGMSGFEALRHLRRHRVTADIPVIMMSGNEQAAEQFYAQKIGADDFMKKPFSREEVLHRVERLLDAGGVPRRAGQADTAPPDTAVDPAATKPNVSTAPPASVSPVMPTPSAPPVEPVSAAISAAVAAVQITPAQVTPAQPEPPAAAAEPEEGDTAWLFAHTESARAEAEAADLRLSTQPPPADPLPPSAPAPRPETAPASLWMTQTGAFSGHGPFGGQSLSSVQIRIDFGDAANAGGKSAPSENKDDPEPRGS